MHRSRKTLRNLSGWWWMMPALGLVGVFVYYPVLQNFQLSLYRWNAFSRAPRYVGLDNYQTMVADPVFWTALVNNIAYAVISLVFQVFCSLVLAAMLEEFVHAKLAGFLRALYFIPAVISITVSGILFSFIYNPEFGLLNQLLHAVGLDGLTHAWLGEQSTAMGSIIAMSQWQSFGYTTVLFIVAIQRIPRELFESARVDGAGRIRSFVSITLPLVREMTTLLIIITVSGAFLVFNEVMVMTAGGPARSTHVLGTWLYFNAFLADDMGYASAIASFIFVITLALAIAQLTYNNRKKVEW